MLRKTLIQRMTICLLAFSSFSAYGFVVEDINVRGVHRLTKESILKNLTIKKGSEYTASTGKLIINQLYSTNLFERISLSRRGDELIITVQERPIISLIKITGAQDPLPAKKLRKVLGENKIAEGEPLNRSILPKIQAALTNLYETQGFGQAHVSVRAETVADNRVALYIDFEKGIVTKVGAINFVGNHKFSSRTLRHQFKLTTPGIFTWFTHKDRYSQVLLDKDLKSLSDFYKNRGYLAFKIRGTPQVVFSPDKKKAYITIYLEEGAEYRMMGYDVTGETFDLKPKLMKALRFLKAGTIASQDKIKQAQKGISQVLANQGYAFANVAIQQKTEEKTHRIFITFVVKPGRLIYVRRINFLGNSRTNQVVLRRALFQYEGSPYSFSAVENSNIGLALLGSVTVPNAPDNAPVEPLKPELKPVPGTSDQVDIDYHLKERPTGSAMFNASYSDLYGFGYGANLSEANFLGEGKAVALGMNNNQYQSNYSFNYVNPYFTSSGISQGVSLFYSRVKPTPKFYQQSYTQDGYGINLNYGYRISIHNSLNFGGGFEHIAISQINPNVIAPSVLDFLKLSRNNPSTDLGRDYNQFKLTAAWIYETRDRTQFPTRGLRSNLYAELGVPILKSSNGYYILGYELQYYKPIGHEFILNLSGQFRYGNGFGSTNQLPFYLNFYAGGIGTLPAYSPNSLGPKNLINTGGIGAIGGNLETVAGVHLILPPWISPKVRTAITLDVGNIFQLPRSKLDLAVPQQIVQNESFSLSNMRTSLGLSVTWLTPFAPITLTLAYPIGKKREFDQTQAFQFSLSTTF